MVDAEGEADPRGARPVHEVGRNADFFDAEAGRLLEAGSALVFPSVHVHSNGTDTTARLDIGFKLHPKGYEPTKEIQFLFFGNGPDIDIRGMAADQRIDAHYVLPEHAKINVFEPHMHAPGVRMCLDAIWGDTVQTLNCAGYDHDWVRVYWYDDDFLSEEDFQKEVAQRRERLRTQGGSDVGCLLCGRSVADEAGGNP